MKKQLNGVFIITILFIALTACTSSNSSPESSEEALSPDITLEEFTQITKGMELDEVIDIIGGEGKQQGETGESGTKAHQVSYVWDGASPNSLVHISFRNNKVSTIKEVNIK
ncbi:hypothetical protein [Bacillus sp. Marseille-Q1617]|uniref:hypothetical protein n=1 Tax=Bacillus sp. Marseille-Q1617 TaxID=2736887 RepID=UPI001589E6C1|nr:hypothetical protein [Bacillus sp. Marseille-Q1617]